MNIGVEKLTLGEAGKPGVHCRNQRALRIPRVTPDAFKIRQRYTVETLHGKNATSTAAFVDPWHGSIFIVGVMEKFPEHLKVVRFLDEVALLQHGALDFLHDSGQRSPG